MSSKKENNPPDGEVDFDTTNSPFRFLAYAARLSRFSRYLAFTSDVGEAFRPVAHPNLVNASYAVSFAYCIGDIGYEGWKSKERKDTTAETTRVVLERSLFQGLASIVLPAITIHSIVNESAKQVKRKVTSGNLDPKSFFARFGPSAIGLACLPLLPVVLDEPVEFGIEKIFDTLWPLNAEQKLRMKGHRHITQHIKKE